MSDHSELLKEARTGADALTDRCHVTAATMIRDLAAVVEAQDKRGPIQSKTVDALVSASNQIGVWASKLRTAVGDLVRSTESKPADTTAELAAACKTCDEVITAVLEREGVDAASSFWTTLRATRYLAWKAHANHEKARGGDGDFVDADEFKGKLDVEQRVVATLREAEAKYDKLMDAVDADDNQAKGN